MPPPKKPPLPKFIELSSPICFLSLRLGSQPPPMKMTSGSTYDRSM